MNPTTPENKSEKRETADQEYADTVWTYRGYKLRASEFTTAMVHLFRAEVSRANVWRQRLDTTTNWAVVTTGAALSIAFSQGGSNHTVILVNILLVTTFLLIEARRYRYYELWSYRVRLMETDFFASMLVPPFHPSPEWSEALAEHLLHPHFQISGWEAFGRRLRSNYLYIYGIVGAAWVAKLWLFPIPSANWETIIERATVGAITGYYIGIIVILFYIGLILLSIFTAPLQQASGEVLPRYGNLSETLSLFDSSNPQTGTKEHAWFRPTHRRKQLISLIITDKAEIVSEEIIKQMNRGVTALNGIGMYTKEAHHVLLCAITVSEIQHLKTLVSATDPNSFVIVSPAQEIYGKGFQAFRTK